MSINSCFVEGLFKFFLFGFTKGVFVAERKNWYITAFYIIGRLVIRFKLTLFTKENIVDLGFKVNPVHYINIIIPSKNPISFTCYEIKKAFKLFLLLILLQLKHKHKMILHRYYSCIPNQRNYQNP